LRPAVVSVAAQGVCLTCISCVSSCETTHDELRPEVSASCVSFAPELSTACVRVASQDKMGMERVQQFEGSYTANCTLCNMQ